MASATSPLDDSVFWSQLPEYSAAVDTPDYTPEPRPDEERLEINHRVIQEESGVYLTQNKLFTLALSKQALDCKEPTYGRGACVQGMITFAKPEGVMSAEVKLHGEMESFVTSAVINGNKIIPIFEEIEVLYKKPGPSNQIESKRHSFFNRSPSSQSIATPTICTEKCPSSLTFALRIPSKYSYDDVTYATPPSFSGSFGNELPGIPGISLSIRYILQITLVKKGSLVDKKSVLSVSLKHIPRSRPARPSLAPSLTFTSTLKISPEEWKLFTADTEIKLGHSKDTPIISAALLLPHSQIYPLGRPIPFHLQLSSDSVKMLAPYAAVASFIDHSSVKGGENTTRSLISGQVGKLRSVPLLQSETPKQQASSSSLTKSFLPQYNPARIHLSVQRHIAVEFMGQWMQLKQCLSHISMRPPVQIENEESSDKTVIAWEGQLEVLEHHRCTGFFGPGIRVRDFIWLCIKAPKEKFPLQDINHLVPIRLTTDPYNEERIQGMEITHGITSPIPSISTAGPTAEAVARTMFPAAFA